MQHRITLSTDLLIAVKGKPRKELKIKPAVKGIPVKKGCEQLFNRQETEMKQFSLYGMEHA